MNTSSEHPGNPMKHRFATTSWSVVIKAGEDSSPEQHQALETLCQCYWYPLYAYLRKSHPQVEAEDITQAFFAELLEKNRLEIADPQRGRFRSFLLASLANFRANRVRHQQTRKRGSGKPPISIDFARANRQYNVEPVDEVTPDILFQRSWAMTLLERAIDRLRQQYTAAGRSPVFEALQGYLNEQTPVPYASIAEQLDMTVEAVRVAVHRLRRRCGQLIREEIGQTVAHPDQIDDELQELFGLF